MNQNDMHDSYYTLLGVAVDASAEQIAVAYQQMRERYQPANIAELGAEFQQISAERLAALDHAYAILSDPARRSAYDQSLRGEAGKPAGTEAVARARGLSKREWIMTAAGALIGLLIIGVVWVFAGQTTQPELPPVATIDRPASDFTLTALDGSAVKLSDYRGKVVLLNFWYTSCPPCKEETPELQAAYQKLADQGLVILGVDLRQNERAGPEGEADIQKFVEDYGITYPVVIDPDGAIGRDYQIYVLPTSLFVDQQGTIRYARFSTLTAEDVEQIFTGLQREAVLQR